MKLWLSVIFTLLMTVGCTSTQSTSSEVHNSHDTRVTAAHAAAHCLNNISARREITFKNWKKSFDKECGSGAGTYFENPQFKEFLSEKSNRVISHSLAE